MLHPQPLPRSTPEAQGVPSQAVLAWLDAVEAAGLEVHSFMLLRAGRVLAEGWWEPYSPGRVHRLNSLSKSFTSTAIGFLVTAGRLSVHDRLVDLFPDALPDTVSDHLAAMRVEDLLTMRCGHAEDPTEAVVQATDDDWERAFLAQPVTYPPGTHFVYNSAATFMLAALVQRLTGETLLDYLRPRLLEPLGIQQAHWEVNPQGIHTGGWGLHLTTDGIARFGQCYLQLGHWDLQSRKTEGQPLIPQAWVQQATMAHVPPGPDASTNDWANGYGYQFWRCRHGAYRSDGAFGQFCIVLPEQQAVLAMTANVPDMQALLNHVWAHLLPAMNPQPLPENPAAQAQLQQRCTALRLALPEFTGHWDNTSRSETYSFQPNPLNLRTARLETTPTTCHLTLEGPQGKQVIQCGLHDWQENRVNLWPGSQEVVLARAERDGSGTLALTLLFIEGGFRWTALADHTGLLSLQTATTVESAADTLIAQRNDHQQP